MTNEYEPTPGDIVKIGNGTVLWEVRDTFSPGPRTTRQTTAADLRRHGGTKYYGPRTRWVEDASRLVLVTPADEERKRRDAEKAAAEEQRVQRYANIRRTIDRVEGFCNEWESRTNNTSQIYAISFMQDGKPVDMALTTDDLRILAQAARK